MDSTSPRLDGAVLARAVGAERPRSRISRGTMATLLAIAFALHVAALTSLEVGFLNPLFNDAENRLGRGADFFAVYQAGHNFLAGMTVYAAADDAVPYAYPFRYLPFVGVTLGALLNLLPPWPAYWGWVTFTEALLLVNVALTWRYASTRELRVVGVAMWLLFTPLYLELYLGQFSFVMASLFFWMGLGLMQSRRGPVVISWAASLLVKANSLLFAPFMWKLGLRKGVIIALAVVALANLPYFLLVDGSLDAWSGNLTFLRGDAVVDPHPGNLGLPALLALPSFEAGESGLERLVVDAAGLPWGLAIAALTTVVTMLSSYRHRLRLLALWICTYFLVFGEVWEHHYVMLLPALVLLVLFDDDLRYAALAVFVLVALPTPYALLQASVPPVDFEVVDPQAYWSTPDTYAQHLIKVAPTALLWLVLLVKVATGDQRDVIANVKATSHLPGLRLSRSDPTGDWT